MKPRNNTKIPIGRIPADTKAWLEVNEKWTGSEIAICSCGKWYHKMDHLAPYHTEYNWCKKCGYECPLEEEIPITKETLKVKK